MSRNLLERRDSRSVGRWPDPRRLPTNRRLPAIYHQADDRPPLGTPSSDDSLTRDPAVAQVEAALLAADEPLAARKLAKIAGLRDGTEARRLVRRLQALYDRDGTAFQVHEIAGGFQLLSRPEYHPWLAKLRRAQADLKLSAAARETLAIIAYRQPIMRADIEAIRGVQCSEVLRQLMEKGLIRIVGRHDSLGRPVLYGTSRKFLQVYGLKDLTDLPPLPATDQPER
ncbi:MAG: SMC-Scp complex subunit ScpB [Gemmataceae bacterium]|nr:SMC-Scp complex subunit ScpB [Gemmataceae bacterium]MDW8264051.1 SMC-Scp complex subunit ScpB [Gemmataceae bacterium]